MRLVRLGNTGIDVSRICLGMMSFGKPGPEHGLFSWARDFDDARPVSRAAVEAGINDFDTANVYQLGTSEEITGQLIRAFAVGSGTARTRWTSPWSTPCSAWPRPRVSPWRSWPWPGC